jgi:signal transduction histidine kinase
MTIEKNAGFERKELKQLVHLSTLINSSLDISTVLENAMQSTRLLLNAEASSIFELDSTRGELFFRTILGANEIIKKTRLKLGEGVVGWVAQTGIAQIVPDTSKDPRFYRGIDARTGFQTRSILAVPMVCKGCLIGVLEVLNKRGEEGFTQGDMELLTILGNQIAVAMENAKLYMRLSEKFALAEEELKAAEQRLIMSERLAALGKLAQGVAHEVRNPAMIIGGFARRLKELFPENEVIEKTVGIIVEQTQRLQQMVLDIETYSRLRNPVFQLVQPPKLMEKIMADLRPYTEMHAIQVKQSFRGEAPTIEVDEELLQMALKNIILNAIESMPKGGALDVEIVPEDDNLVINVRDSGVGIPSENLRSIFDPFFTSKMRGSGMGLTTAHRIISNHAGEISVVSRLGQGTEVRVRLPFIAPKQE